MHLPSEFISKLERLLGNEAAFFLQSYEYKKISGLRLNPLKINMTEWNQINPFSLEKVPFVEYGFYYDPEKDQPGKHPFHAAGLYYIQEPSAMFVAEQLAPKAGEKVLDLCAAPGGKTTQLAGMLGQEGLLVANEINAKRAKALSENIERLGVSNALVTNETPERLAERFQGYFDKILVDAPCSGEGMFRKDEEAISFWSEEHVVACSRQQRVILDSAYQMLKEGGILVYSTCTFSPEENEQTIEHFLKKYPDLEVVPIDKPKGIVDGRPDWAQEKTDELKYTARLWPHHLNGEGHFAAKLRKTAPAGKTKIDNIAPNAKRGQLKDFQEFTGQALEVTHFNNLFLFNQQLYSLPDDCPNFKGLKVLRTGLHLGEFKKNRFEPNHALALTLSRQEAKNVLTLTMEDGQWLRYLKGETLMTEKDRGWTLVTIDGYSIGWGKEVKGTLKNFYPKGLRILG